MIVTIMIMIAMLIDRDTPAVCAADSGADARRIANGNRPQRDNRDTPAVKAELAPQQLESIPTCGGAYNVFLHSKYDAFGAVIRDAHITIQ